MTIRIEALEFEAILGILDVERNEPQRIRIDTEITYRYDSERFLDYAQVASAIESIVKERKFHLVEETLETLFFLLKEKFPRIETIKITICKPDILPNCRVCVEDFRSFL
ncbi:dihydroneopterin aldolase [Hydrogenimonas sp.]